MRIRHRNIGTVHKFQGKEANEVIFLLGCDTSKDAEGAIRWVNTNIVNVANDDALSSLSGSITIKDGAADGIGTLNASAASAGPLALMIRATATMMVSLSAVDP